MTDSQGDANDGGKSSFGAHTAWTVLGILISGMLVWGLLGWLVDQWLGTRFVAGIGVVVGVAAAIVVIVYKFAVIPQSEKDGDSAKNSSDDSGGNRSDV